MEKSYQDRMAIVLARVDGNQSELARRVSALLGTTVTPQAIQKLASRTSEKPAQGSSMNAAIAAVTGVRAQWLEYGEEPMVDPLAQLDRTTYALLMAAAEKLAAPTLDGDVRETALGALRLVAKQDIPPLQQITFYPHEGDNYAIRMDDSARLRHRRRRPQRGR